MAALVVHSQALLEIADGTLLVLSDDLVAVLLAGGWEMDPLLDWDITTAVPAGSILTAPETLTGRVVANGRLYADTLTFPAVAPGDVVTGLLVYRADDGLLISFHHRRADSRQIAVVTDGSDLEWVWSNDGVLTI